MHVIKFARHSKQLINIRLPLLSSGLGEQPILIARLSKNYFEAASQRGMARHGTPVRKSFQKTIDFFEGDFAPVLLRPGLVICEQRLPKRTVLFLFLEAHF